MKVAFLLENELLCNLNKYLEERKIRAVIFNVEKDQYTHTQDDYFSNQSFGYLSLWILNKHIDIIFVSNVEPDIKRLFLKIGTIVEDKTELDNNPLFRDLYLSLFQ